MPLRNADKIFYIANFTRNLPVLLNLKNPGSQGKLFQRKTNSLKDDQKKVFDPILVRHLELQCVRLEEN